MYEALSWKLESWPLPPTPHKHLYLWSDHHTKGVRCYSNCQYWKLLSILSVIFFPYIYIVTQLLSHIIHFFSIFFFLLNFSSLYSQQTQKQQQQQKQKSPLPIRPYIWLHFLQHFSSLLPLYLPPLLSTSPLHFLHPFLFLIT